MLELGYLLIHSNLFFFHLAHHYYFNPLPLQQFQMAAITAASFAKFMLSRSSVPEEKLLNILEIPVEDLHQLLIESNAILNKFKGKIYKAKSELSNEVIYSMVYHGKYMHVDQSKSASNFFKSLINRLIQKVKYFHEARTEDTVDCNNLDCYISEHDALRDYKGSVSQAEELLGKFITTGYLEIHQGQLYLGITSKYGLANLLQPYMKTCTNTAEMLIYYKYCCGHYYHPFQICQTCKR